MKSIIDTASIFRYHKYMILEHSNGNHRALGWKDIESQLSRFNVLAQIADLNCCSVLDAGCGHADLSGYLSNIYPDVRYYGIEQIPEFLGIAIQRYGNLPDIVLYQGDFYTAALPHVDYTLVSGSLNYYNSDPDYVYKAIKKLFKCSRHGLGFNLLSHVIENSVIISHDPEDIVNYCRTLTRNVVLKDDYSDEDYTVFIYH